MAKIPSFEDGNPSDWPSNFSEFKELETILGCGICFEYMSTAMMTKCSHNFCSLCIRRYICYKGQCPICLDAVLESDLRTNRIVDEITQHFTKSRTKLLTLAMSNPGIDQSQSMSNCTDMKESVSAPASERINTGKSISSPDLGNFKAKISELDSAKKWKAKPDVLSSYFLAGKNKTLSKASSSTSSPPNALSGDSSFVVVDVDSGSDVTIDGDPVSCPPTCSSNKSDDLWSAKQTKLEYETLQTDLAETKHHPSDSDIGSSDHLGSFSSSQSSSNQLVFSSPIPKPLESSGSLSVTPSGLSSTSASFGVGLLSPATATVTCPVCNTGVSSRYINLHLDRCLATEQKKDRPARQTLKHKPMPKLVYTLLSEKDLRKKLSEVGLPVNGNRQALVKRHHEFTLLYNAQCDSLHPKSVQEIVSEMIQADALKSRLATQSSATTNLKLDKTSTAEQVELAQKEYRKKHKAQFRDLMKAARRNREVSADSADSVSTVAETAATSSDADLASEVIESSSPNTEPQAEGRTQRDPETDSNPAKSESAQRDPETESNPAKSESPKASTSADIHVSRPIRRIRRKLSVDTHDQQTGTEESASTTHQALSVAVRRSLRSCASKKKPSPSDSTGPADAEDAEDSEGVNISVDNDDDDYKIMPSYSGRKRKAGNSNKVPRPPKTRKPENVAQEPNKSSPLF